MTNKNDILDFKLSRAETGPGSKIGRNKVIYAKWHGLKGQYEHSISELAKEYDVKNTTISSIIKKVQGYIDRQKRYDELKKIGNETILNSDVNDLPYPGSRTYLFPLTLRARFENRNYVTVKDVLDAKPEKLLSIDGIGIKTLQDFYNALDDWGIGTPQFKHIFVENVKRCICPSCGRVHSHNPIPF